MAYTNLDLENLAELKLRVGNSTDTTTATILGINYPLNEGWVTYHWRNTSTATPDDFEVVCPTPRIGLAGRWFRIDTAQILQVNSDWNSTSGVSEILNKPTTISGSGITDVYDKTQSDSRYLQSFTETDPTVPSHVKSITTTDISEWDDSYSWGDHNSIGYLTEDSFSNLTNKSGNISQWTNDSNYLTSVPAQSFSSLTGKPTTLSGYGITDAYPLAGNPSGFLTSVPAQSWTSITGKPTFATVATSGAYSDLSGKPSLATVATSGSYNDLTSKPTIVQQYGTSYTKEINLKATTSSATHTFDISAAGFSSVTAIQVSSFYNGANVNNASLVSVTAYSTTSVSVILVESKNTAVLIGGNIEGLEDHARSGTEIFLTVKGN